MALEVWLLFNFVISIRGTSSWDVLMIAAGMWRILKSVKSLL